MNPMKAVYLALSITCMFLLVGTLERQWGDPLRERREPKAQTVIMSHPCATWVCKGSYTKCQDSTNRRCTKADFRGIE